MTSRYPGGLVRRTAANTAITGASGVWDLGSQAQAVKNNTWPISGLANPVSGSLRFRSSASASLSRTPASASNRRTWTWSGWIKRGDVSTNEMTFFSAGTDASNFTALAWNNNNLFFQNYTSGTQVTATSTAVFRDPSAWYHVVLAIDTTQATAADRAKIYVNGVQQAGFSGSSLTLNQQFWINFTYRHTISARSLSSIDSFTDQYMSEINFIDGQALTPSYFGQTSAITGVWEPIKYTGTYGTNGFYLSLSDTSSIGKDFSGNVNNWTPNNISTTSGSTFDLMRDVPTQYTPQGATDIGGVVRGNYCTWNPLNKSSNHNSTNGNLTASSSGGTSYGAICATMGVTSGKWYWEMTYTRNGATNSPVIGFGNDLFTYTNPPFGYLGSDLNGGGINVFNGNAAINATSTAYGSAIATNDVVIFAMDLDNRKFYVGKNGTWFNSGNPVSGTNQWPYSATIVGSTFFPAVNMFNDTGDTNFGQRPFAYTPPTGFKSLCTTNLPTPTIGATAANAANKYFDATLYTGTGATLSVTNAGGFQPDFVWLKSRSATTNHQLFDAVRGTTKVVVGNTTESESTSANTITSFNSGGFTVGTNTAINTSAATYVGWQWWAGGSTVTNTSGSITSTVRASTTAGFSVVTYIGNGTGGATIGHGLGAAPGMLMFKNRDETGGNSILVWHSSFTNQGQMLLSSTAAIYNPGNGLYFNSTTPGASVVTLGTSGSTNASAVNMLMYAWTPIAGFSAFGSYTGNASTDGPFIHTGFRPRYVMFKRSDSTDDWIVIDSTRSPYNVAILTLYANGSYAEDSNVTNRAVDYLSNGFKIRSSGVYMNASGGTYIYMAFAETPFKNSLAR